MQLDYVNLTCNTLIKHDKVKQDTVEEMLLSISEDYPNHYVIFWMDV